MPSCSTKWYLVSAGDLKAVEEKLHSCNEIAPIWQTNRCQVDIDLLFGIAQGRVQEPPQHVHQPEFESFSYTTHATFDRQCFTEFAASLEMNVYRAKGFVQFQSETYLFNLVAGRWELELFEQQATALVFIGKQLSERKAEILNRLQLCEQ